MEASDAFGYSDCWTMVPFPETGNGAGGASQAAEIKSSVLGISMVGVQHIFLRIEKLRSVINSHAFFFFSSSVPLYSLFSLPGITCRLPNPTLVTCNSKGAFLDTPG